MFDYQQRLIFMNAYIFTYICVYEYINICIFVLIEAFDVVKKALN